LRFCLMVHRCGWCGCLELAENTVNPALGLCETCAAIIGDRDWRALLKSEPPFVAREAFARRRASE
jgi:hypothetical protein